jgi:hypothetical protein
LITVGKIFNFSCFTRRAILGVPGFKNTGTERVGDTVLLNSVVALMN